MGFDTDHSSGDLGLRPSLISPLVSTLSPPSLQPPPSSQSQQQPQQQQEELKLSKEVETKMKRWVKGFCEVVFNLDEGPELTQLYPPTLSTLLSPFVQQNVAFSSLPEGEMPTASGSCSYSWRIPFVPAGREPSGGERGEREKGKGKKVEEVEESLFGFVWFLQEKNTELKRNYTQRSLVLMTTISSLSGLFSTLIGILGPLYFKHDGVGVIENACRNLGSWPDLVPGSLLDLPFLGKVLTVEIPLLGQSQWSSGGHIIPASLPLTPLSSSMHEILTYSKILLLWELVILGEPILVYCNDVRTGSELVWHLKGLIRPLIFEGDFRPNLHIHDNDFQALVNSKKPKPGLIISTTNPLILSSCKHWPNILRATTSNKGNEVPGLVSTRKRHLKKDVEVERNLDEGFRRGDYIGSDAILFRHLTTLTERFLAPLNRYFGTLPSTDTSLSRPLTSNSFSPSSFLLSLKSHGTALQFRLSSPTENFYKKFLESPNFDRWLRGREEVSGEIVRKKYLERLIGTDLRVWSEGRRREDLDELLERIEDEAIRSEDDLSRVIPPTPTTTAALNIPTAKSNTNNSYNSNNEKLQQVSISSSPETIRSAQLWMQAKTLRVLKADT